MTIINMGWGNFSSPISQRTFDGAPSEPRDIERDFRNQSCIGIRWVEPLALNGILTSYTVSCDTLTFFVNVMPLECWFGQSKTVSKS